MSPARAAKARCAGLFYFHLATLALIALPAIPASAQTNSALATHWGALAFPTFQRGWQSGLTFLSFTELDGKGRKFGAVPGDTSGRDPYPETVGFNLFSLAYANHLNPEATELANMLYRYGVSLGVNGDALTEHYQNEIIHRAYRDFAPVPRDGVRCEDDWGPGCLDYSLDGEILYRFTDLELEDRLRFSASSFFTGAGMSLGSAAWEGYLHFGLADFPTLISTSWFGLRVASAARLGGVIQNPLRDRWGRPVFRDFASGYWQIQGGVRALFGERIYPVVIGNFFTYHTGFWTDAAGRPVDNMFWTLTIEIDQLYFETFNDMLGGADHGPTFGVRTYWDFEGRSGFFRGLERFVKGLNRP